MPVNGKAYGPLYGLKRFSNTIAKDLNDLPIASPQVTFLELDLRFQLDHPGGNIASKPRSQDAGRWHLHRSYLAERGVRAVVVGRAEIRMIEKIEELGTNAKHHLVTDEACFLHDGKVSIEIARIAKTVASLRNGNGRA